MDLSDFNTPMLRLVALVVILSNLGFAIYIYRDETFPLRQRWPFILGALITGPFLFGRLYFKKVERRRQRELNEAHRRYAARRQQRDEED